MDKDVYEMKKYYFFKNIISGAWSPANTHRLALFLTHIIDEHYL